MHHDEADEEIHKDEDVSIKVPGRQEGRGVGLAGGWWEGVRVCWSATRRRVCGAWPGASAWPGEVYPCGSRAPALPCTAMHLPCLAGGADSRVPVLHSGHRRLPHARKNAVQAGECLHAAGCWAGHPPCTYSCMLFWHTPHPPAPTRTCPHPPAARPPGHHAPRQRRHLPPHEALRLPPRAERRRPRAAARQGGARSHLALPAAARHLHNKASWLVAACWAGFCWLRLWRGCGGPCEAGARPAEPHPPPPSPHLAGWWWRRTTLLW